MSDNVVLDREEARRAQIIEVAFDVAMRYGYKRTTMDDIAKAAGMSRPALYLLYRNKNDIFRACLENFIEVTRADIAACFERDLPPLEQISAALIIGIVTPMRKIMASPHGTELLELKYDIAEDLSKQWIRMVEQEVDKGLQQAIERQLIRLPNDSMSAAQIAGFLADAAEGIKHRMTDPDAMEKRLHDLVLLIIAPIVC